MFSLTHVNSLLQVCWLSTTGVLTHHSCVFINKRTSTQYTCAFSTTYAMTQWIFAVIYPLHHCIREHRWHAQMHLCSLSQVCWSITPSSSLSKVSWSTTSFFSITDAMTRWPTTPVPSLSHVLINFITVAINTFVTHNYVFSFIITGVLIQHTRVFTITPAAKAHTWRGLQHKSYGWQVFRERIQNKTEHFYQLMS